MRCISFGTPGPAASNTSQSIAEEAGFQLKLRSLVHTADIMSVVYVAESKFVAAGDAGGGVSLLNVSRPELLWHCQASSHAVARVLLASAQLKLGFREPPTKVRWSRDVCAVCRWCMRPSPSTIRHGYANLRNGA